MSARSSLVAALLGGLLTLPVNQTIGAHMASTQGVLQTSTDRDLLEREASALARAGDQASIDRLQHLLTDPQFLGRLDDIAASDTRHVARVVAALRANGSPRAVALGEVLADDPAFTADSDRKGLAIDFLASVVPMREQTAAIIQRSNEEGYFASNARLLIANGSPVALRLFEQMMVDKEQPAEVRVESLHVGLAPRRTQAAALRVAGHVLAAAAERSIITATVESIFDYNQEWFSIESGIVEPPTWAGLPTEARQAALALADQALARRDLPAPLRAKVVRERQRIASSGPGPR